LKKSNTPEQTPKAANVRGLTTARADIVAIKVSVR